MRTVVEGEAAAEVHIEHLGSSETSAGVGFLAQAGTATAGQDFLPANTTVTFGAGEMENTVSIPILDDLVTEGNETVLLSVEGTKLGHKQAEGYVRQALTSSFRWHREREAWNVKRET